MIASFISTSNYVGNYIRKKRKELGLSLDQVCMGVCSKNTLSRIERGEQEISWRMVDALLGRVGISDWHYLKDYGFASNKDKREYELSYKSEVGMQRGAAGIQMLQEVYDEIKDDPHYSKGLSLQFKLSVYATLLLRSQDCGILETNYQEVGDALLSVIKVTIPDFDIEKIQDLYLTPYEVNFLAYAAANYNNIACVCNHAENIKISLRYFQVLKDNFEKHNKNFYERESYYGIMMNYCNILKAEELWNECLETTEAIFEYSTRYFPFSNAIFIFANTLSHYYLGKEFDYERHLKQAYYLLDISGFYPSHQEKIACFAKDKLNLDLTIST